MRFPREKRLMLGGLALLAPLPLPFNQAVSWGLVLVYLLLVAAFLQRADRGDDRWLSNWALNGLGLAYLPLLVIDLRFGIARSDFLRPLLHLLLFLVVVKLFSLRRERDKWLVSVAILFLFHGSMATSTHMTVVPYLVAFMVAMVVVLARFAHLYVLGAVGIEATAPAASIRWRRPASVVAIGTALLAVPLFATMPRFREPLAFGDGVGQEIRRAGFGDSVDLSRTSAIRGNRAVVLRLRLRDGAAPNEWRIKGATYDRYENQRWARGQGDGSIASVTVGRPFRIAPGIVVGQVDIFLEPIRNRSMMLPVEAVTFEGLDVPGLYRDPGGAFSFPSFPRETIGYRVGLAGTPTSSADTDPAALALALDDTSVTPRMRILAQDVMGVGPDAERIARLERYLIREYDYTLDHVGRIMTDPIEDFLFQSRRGHCELFATSMVLMLRSQGVPARLATGFLDAERNALQDYYIVRQGNAHAWVEAYDEVGGWRVWDPTPPEGRPSAEPWDLRMGISQLYDAMIFRWDRYVLSFDADDQRAFFDRLRTAVGDWWRRVRGGPDTDANVPRPTSPGASPVAPAGAVAPAAPASAAALLLLALATLVILVTIAWRRQRLPDASAAYRRLLADLGADGCPIDRATAPLEVADLVGARYPEGGPAAALLVARYLEESFGERPLVAHEQREVVSALRAVQQAVRAARAERRRRPTPAVTPAA